MIIHSVTWSIILVNYHMLVMVLNDKDIAVGRVVSCMHIQKGEESAWCVPVSKGGVEREWSGKSELCVLRAHSVWDFTLVRLAMMGFFFPVPPSILSLYPFPPVFLPSLLSLASFISFTFLLLLSSYFLCFFQLELSLHLDLEGCLRSSFACHMEAPL